MTIIEEKDAFVRECKALAELRLDREKRFNSDEASVTWKYQGGEMTFRIEGSQCRLEATHKILGRLIKQPLTPFLLTHLEETIDDTLVYLRVLPREAATTISR